MLGIIKSAKNMRKICNFVIKYSIYLLVFLIPLFWLPWSVEVFDFNKQYLVVFLVSLAFLAWLAKMVVIRKKIVLRRTPLDIWVLAFIVIMTISAFFSVDKISSWLGFYGRFSDSMITLLAMAAFYFVLVNNVSVGKKQQKESDLEETEERGKKSWGFSLEKVFNLFLASSFVVIITTYLSVFGIWAKISGLPHAMTFKSFNPIASSLEGLSMFLVALISLIVGMFLQRVVIGKEKKFSSAICLSLVILATLLLVFINFSMAWLVLGITMLILLAVVLWTRTLKKNVDLLILPVILIIIAGFYWFGVPSKVGALDDLTFDRLNLSQEVILDYQTAGSVSWDSLKEYPVLGSGPGTFSANFTRFKPVSFNENPFWNIRFDKAPSQLLEMVSTTGALGTLSYLMLIVVFLLVVFVFFGRRIMDSQYSKLGFPLVLAWLSLLLAQFVYYQNSVLIFYFWFFMALIVIIWQEIQSKPAKKIVFSFKKVPEAKLIFNIILLILVFALAGLFYLGGRFYWAEAKLSQSSESNEDLIRTFEEAINLSKYRANYRQTLSQIYLASAWSEARKAEGERNVQLLQGLAAGSIQQAREATSLRPNSVNAWENLGVIYRDSRGLIDGTVPFTIEAFERAKELEPNNPVFYREICRVNLIDGEGDWDKTVGYCQKAVELKPNYLDAHIQLALAYEQGGNLEEAVRQMESVLERLKGVSFQRDSDLAGAATEIYFQLGRLYFNLDREDEAINMFEQAVIITPEYANARYALALSYQSKERIQDALVQLRIIEQLVPDDEDVKTLIDQLSTPADSEPVEE